jgi:AraC-like DNA-binding protein
MSGTAQLTGTSGRTQITRRELELGSWTYAARAPHPRLRFLFARPWLVGCEYELSFERWLEPPPPALTLIVALGDPLRSGRGTLPAAWLAGLDDRAELVETGGRQALIDVKLTPVGAYALCGRALRELRGEVVDLEELFGPQGRQCSEALRQAPRGWDERFDLLERFMARRVELGVRAHPIVLDAWLRLRASAGRLPIGTLARELGASRRHLSTTFHEQLGLPPKTFARLVRFQEVRARMGREPVRWAEVAYECGYSDQSHLNRDFRELAGTTPTDFLARLLPAQGAPSIGTVGDGITFVQDAGPATL